MKVLHVAQYIYDKSYKEFTKSKSGLGIMVQDICASLADYDEVFLLTHRITPGHRNKYTILKHTWWDVIKNIKFKNVLKGFKVFLFTKTNLRAKLHLMYYAINVGCLEYWIKKLSPDIVHIHEYTPSMMGFIRLCHETKTTFMVTCHGLLAEKKCEFYVKESEKQIMDLYKERNFYITTVSTSVKEKLIKYYHVENSLKIEVIFNGVEAKETPFMYDKKAPYVLLCVGQLSEGKNQSQIIDAVSLMHTDVKDKIKVYLIGNDLLNGELQKKIETCGLQNQIICTGFMEREELNQYYESAAGVIVASLTEGFGLPIVEAMMYGIPVAIFSDIDAVKDLYSESAFVLVDQRTAEALSGGIEELITRNWNKDQIRSHAQKFSLESMSIKYHEIYRKCCPDKE